MAIIIGNIVLHGAGKLSWEFLSQPPRDHFTKGGIFPAIFGTAALVILMTIAVIPLGVATAIYMHEYAPKRSRLVHLVRLAIQNLAGVPAIVFGLFGVGFFIEFVGRGLDRGLYGGRLVYGQPAIIWSALTMALLTLPTVVVATEEALRAIPTSLPGGRLFSGCDPLADDFGASSSRRRPEEYSRAAFLPSAVDPEKWRR